MAELADAQDLGSCAPGRVGSKSDFLMYDKDFALFYVHDYHKYILVILCVRKEIHMRKIKMSNSKRNVTVDEAYVYFLHDRELNNLTEVSIKSYREKVGPFVKWATGKYISDIDSDVVDDYKRLLLHEELSYATLASYLRNVRTFLYFCMSKGWLETYKIALPKGEKPVKEVYSDDDLSKLLKKPDTKTCSFAEYRTWVFEVYLIGTGNRLSTALNVRIRDVDFSNGLIALHKTKNRKAQYIPLSRELSGILRGYLKVRGGEPDDFIFCNCYGEKAANRSYQDCVRRYNKSRGVDITSIHAFRHTFAKNWILSGGDVFRLQKILGHSDLTVTREYVNLYSGDLKLDFEKFNPLGKYISPSRKNLRL